ncbi:asparaginase domain-containing protein [Teredinibacter haidensis]|uniref:asparaginase domain-containing protein n=1 Tax=Teredinibacter haidensis TaxID=2731755 RepID=UPI000948B2C7|nr:asparaginase domain-containing protein [Teredinibacter haidensis]
MPIKIFTTGGTIDKTYFDQKSSYHVGEPQASGVLERANVVVGYEVVSLMKKDSLDLDDSDREVIRNAIVSAPEDRIIVTHGTDTMIITAEYLQQTPNKTIVLTGSMYPAQYRDSDAVFNLGGAMIGVQVLDPGVYIAMNGRIFDPLAAVKNVPLNRFEERSP